MNIKPYISSNNYISSPITVFHCINYKIKVLFIFSFLSLLPYLCLNNYSIILIFFLTLTTILISKIIDSINIIKGFKLLSLYMTYTIFTSYCIDISHQNKFDIYFSSISLPYCIKFFQLQKENKVFYQLTFNYLVYQMPRYIIKIAIINIISIILIQILSTCTRNEMIADALINISIKISNLKFYNFNRCIMAISISSQLLERVIENIIILFLAVKIKNSLNTNNFIFQIIPSGKKYLVNLVEDHNYTSLIFWIRRIDKDKSIRYIE